MVDDPLQVLGLQVGDAHVAHNAFIAQLHKCRQCLVDHLLQTARQSSLKLYVVHIDEVDIVDAQSLHALIDAAGDTLSRIVPHVDTILAIAAHLRGEVVLVTWNLVQRLTQHLLGLQMAIVGRHIDEVNTIIYGHVHGTNAFFFTDAVEHAAKRRCTKRQCRNPHSGFSNFVINHIYLVTLIFLRA